MGVSIIAGTVDTQEQTLEVATPLGFPVAWGMSRSDADSIGSWWEDHRNHIQPSEFVITQAGRVLSSTYSSSPIGRVDPEETLTLMKFLTRPRS